MPIDPDFQKNLRVTGEHAGHKVWEMSSCQTNLGSMAPT